MITTLRACWAPPGFRPAVLRQISRKYFNEWVTVSPRDGRSVFSHTERSRAIEMSEHLRSVRRAFPHDLLVMFLDGASWHGGRDLVVPESMHLHHLLPYSPELNPAEQIWDYLRENFTANFTFDDLFALEVQVGVACTRLQRAHDVVRSLTLYPWIERAASRFGKLIV